ncbi:unnamed protein product, partial [Nesidiocoris tenuis]
MLNNAFPFCYHNRKFMLHEQESRNWKTAWRRTDGVSKLCLHLSKKLLETSPLKRIRIYEVVNHQWFHGLTVPKAHSEAMDNAQSIFESKKPKVKTGVAETIYLSKPEKDLLDDIYNHLESMVKSKGGKRIFKPFKNYPGYQKCYVKRKRRSLLGRIDASLRKPASRPNKDHPPYELEQFISDKDETDFYDKLVLDIEELKKHQEEVRKIWDPREDRKSATAVLAELVKKIKNKMEIMEADEAEFEKRQELLSKSKTESEPRSILQMR